MDLNFEINCVPIFRFRMVEATGRVRPQALPCPRVAQHEVSWSLCSWTVLGSVPGLASVCQTFVRQSVGHSRAYTGLDSSPTPFLEKT